MSTSTRRAGPPRFIVHLRRTTEEVAAVEVEAENADLAYEKAWAQRHSVDQWDLMTQVIEDTGTEAMEAKDSN